MTNVKNRMTIRDSKRCPALAVIAKMQARVRPAGRTFHFTAIRKPSHAIVTL